MSMPGPQVKSREGNTGASNVTISPTASHTIKPAHVNARTTPEGCREDHAIIRLSHVAAVSTIRAEVKAGLSTLLLHPDVSLIAILEVGNQKGFVGVDGASVLRADHVGVNIESIVLATSTITFPPVSRAATAGVEGTSNGIFVGLKGVILRAPLSSNKVSITVVVSTITTSRSRHVNEVASGIAVASNTAQIKSVREVFSIQRSLPEHVAIPSISWVGGQVDSATTIQSEPIAVHLNVPSCPVGTHNIDLANAINIDASKVLSPCGCSNSRK